MKFRIAAIVVIVALLVPIGIAVWKWGFCYKWCDQGYSLKISRKTGEPAGDQYAQEGQKGVIEQLRGPGRHLDLDARTGADRRDDRGRRIRVGTRRVGPRSGGHRAAGYEYPGRDRSEL